MRAIVAKGGWTVPPEGRSIGPGSAVRLPEGLAVVVARPSMRGDGALYVLRTGKGSLERDEKTPCDGELHRHMALMPINLDGFAERGRKALSWAAGQLFGRLSGVSKTRWAALVLLATLNSAQDCMDMR